MNARLTAILTWLLLFAAIAAGAEDEKSEKETPSFRPGADVELAITLKAPKQWKINHQMPLSFSFESEYLQDAPISVNEDSVTVTVRMDSSTPELTVSVPVVINESTAEGRLTIPIPVTFSICNEVTNACAFSQETVTVPVEVLRTADPGNKHQALEAGQVEHSHLLSVP